MSNLTPACHECGQSKADLTVHDWALVLAAEIVAARPPTRPAWRWNPRRLRHLRASHRAANLSVQSSARRRWI